MTLPNHDRSEYLYVAHRLMALYISGAEKPLTDAEQDEVGRLGMRLKSAVGVCCPSCGNAKSKMTLEKMTLDGNLRWYCSDCDARGDVDEVGKLCIR